jgi:coatomer protein complex subunit epsilon
MVQGGSKIREAYLIFQDFAEKYPMTGMVLNGKAVCCMHMGSFDEAETLLLEALNKVCTDCPPFHQWKLQNMQHLFFF